MPRCGICAEDSLDEKFSAGHFLSGGATRVACARVSPSVFPSENEFKDMS